ncbi:hypothetical protein BSKO_08509 [Bryopsis sp. KO-2023]|nr:hypothetical protein BSKO_08509 [Bryopsis sp. KO-2023]
MSPPLNLIVSAQWLDKGTNNERDMSAASIDQTKNGGPSVSPAGCSAEAILCPDTGALWSFSLTFYDSKLESRYQSEIADSRHRHEKRAHLMGLVSGIVLTSIRWANVSWAGRAIMLTQGVLLPAIVAFMVWHRKETYMQLRSAMVILVTTHPLLLSHLVLESPVSQAWQHVLGCILFKSPAGFALLLSTNWSLCFRGQLLLQHMTLPGLFSWAKRFCACCESSEMDYQEAFGIFGAVLDRFPAFVSLIPPPCRILGCFEVTLAIVLVAGFLLPILAVYLLDLHRREAFAKNHLSSNMDVAIDRNSSDSWFIGILYFFAAAEIVVMAVVM